MNYKSLASCAIALVLAYGQAPNVVTASPESEHSAKTPSVNLAKAKKAFEHCSFAEVTRLLAKDNSEEGFFLQARAVEIVRSGDASFFYLRASQIAPTPLKEVYKALALLSSTRSSSALDVLRPIYARYPSNPEVMSTYGRCLCTADQSEKGRELMRVARLKDPKSEICSDNLSNVAKLNFAVSDALESLGRDIAAKPHSVPLRLRRAIVFSESGQLKESLGDFDAALKENPDCQYTYYQRATVYRNMQKYDKAIADLVRSEQCPEKDRLVSQRVLRLKVDCEDQSHHVSSAVADSRALIDSYRGLKLSRGMRADILHRVTLLEKQNQCDAALKALQPMMHDYSDRSEVLTVQARLLGKLKRYKESLAIADKLVARDNEMWEWHQIRGLALAGLGDTTRAEHEFAQAKSLKSEYSDLPQQLRERIK
ncbi:MAG TPA: tetratricopeptide repeat protein [Drouetiella sp.]